MKNLLVASAVLCLPAHVSASTPGTVDANTFNPAVSVIFDGRWSDYDDEFELPGFQVGGEAELPEQDWSWGHNELNVSATLFNQFYTSASYVFTKHEGETEKDLEEIYLETLTLGNGLTLRMGEFFSHIGYHNALHQHAWEFIEAPLVYSGLFGNHIDHEGVQLRWLAPTDSYLEFGFEAGHGSGFPGGSDHDDQAYSSYIKWGDDWSVESSWQLGLSWYDTSFSEREGGGHAHGGGGPAAVFTTQNTDSTVWGIDAVYKWAPMGNSKNQQLILQAEYFERDEDGHVNLSEDANFFNAAYEGKQKGYYLQGIYKFKPRWKTGLRYDWISADNRFGDLIESGVDFDEFSEDTEFNNDNPIKRWSSMISYSKPELWRVRLQYNHIDVAGNVDDQLFLQFTLMLGAHGAHRY